MTTAVDMQLFLRPYQQEAIQAIYDATTRGINRPLITLPTGTGKTVVFSHLIGQRDGRSLILVHRDELLQQAVDKLATIDPALGIGVVKAERDNVAAQVIVASVQTLARSQRLARLVPDFRTIVIDEAHHCRADNTYYRILDYLGSFNDNGPLTLGVTATPFRSDGQPLAAVFQEIVYEKNILEMITNGYLSDLRAIQVLLEADLDTLHTRGGDFVESELGTMMIEADAPTHVLAAFTEHAADRKALIFTPTVATAHAMAEAFSSAGIAAEALDGSTPLDERRDLLKRLHTGDTQVVANCAVLTEGFDEPSIDCIIVARPTKSKVLYTQMIGRGTRKYPGKDDCLILDVVGATSRHSLLAAAALFDVDPKAIKEQTVTEVVAERRRCEREAETQGRMVSATVDLFTSRALKWIQTKRGAWVLTLGKGSVRLVQEGQSAWRVVHLQPDTAPQILGRNLSLEYAQGVGEDIARQAGATGLLDPNARWRKEEPTAKQLALLKRWGLMRPGITKGEASDLITARVGDWN